MLAGVASQGLEKLGEQSQGIPVQGLEETHRAVGKPPQLAELEALTVEATEDTAAAFSAEIEG